MNWARKCCRSKGTHETVDAWFVRGDQRSTLVLTNFALPRHPIETEQVSFALKSARPAATASMQRIDLEHANAKRHWEQLGEPEYLSAAMVDELKDAVAARERAGSGRSRGRHIEH